VATKGATSSSNHTQSAATIKFILFVSLVSLEASDDRILSRESTFGLDQSHSVTVIDCSKEGLAQTLLLSAGRASARSVKIALIATFPWKADAAARPARPVPEPTSTIVNCWSLLSTLRRISSQGG